MGQFFLGVLSTAFVGALGWFTLEFVARPIRRFFDLRGEVRKQMLRFGNVQWFDPILARYNAVPAKDGEFEQAVKSFRDLGSQMIAFGETEWLAASAARFLRFNPVEAGEGLIGFSNTLDQYRRAERADYRAKIDTALRFPD